MMTSLLGPHPEPYNTTAVYTNMHPKSILHILLGNPAYGGWYNEWASNALVQVFATAVCWFFSFAFASPPFTFIECVLWHWAANMQFQLHGLAVNHPVICIFLSHSATVPYTVSKFHLGTFPLLKINHLWQTKMKLIWRA